MTFDELFSRAIQHAERAEQLLAPETSEDPAQPAPEILREKASIEATLAETYARLFSGAVVNRTSMHALVEAEHDRGGPRPS